MNDGLPRHPEAQTMAAFVDGTLPPAEVAAVAEHLRGCGECRTVVSEAARFTDEEEPRGRRTWWLAAAAAVVLAVIIAVPFVIRRTASPLAKLIAAAPTTHRNVEGQLAGFRWANLKAATRGKGVADPEDLKLGGAAGSVLESADAHAKGVAYLLIDRRSESADMLETATERSKDPAVWSDLAAARLAIAVRDDRPAQLPLALAATDHALRLDPAFAPALFNRALVLEHLGLRDAARTAWRQYLDANPTGDWSAEARAHLAKLEERGEVFDRKAVEHMVRRFPQESRTYAEGPLLVEWAGKRSTEILDRARAAGSQLAAFHGELLLADSVAAIDRADEQTRNALADAYRIYGEGRRSYAEHQVALAEPSFRRAATIFRRCGSAMADEAEYYAGECAVDQHRGTGELKRLQVSIDRNRHHALLGEIESELALAANIAGDPGAAIHHADAASEAFRTLGERMNAADADGLAAVALSLAGDSERAWRRFIRAFDALPPSRRQSLLQVASSILVWSDEPEAAASLIRVWGNDSRASTPYARASAFAREARIDRSNAALALARARAALAQISDAGLREAAAAEVDLADDVTHSCSVPHAFDSAVSFMSAHAMKSLLPDALLERARAFRAAGDERSALDDCAAALAAMDQRGRDIGATTLASEIVEEMIDIHLKRGDVPAAFAVADRSHAAPPALPPRTALVEYVALPRSLIIFSYRNGDLRAGRVSIPRRRVAALERTLAEKAAQLAPESDVRAASAKIYEVLIAPVEGRISAADELIVIPDRHTTVPFSVLYDGRRGRYLIEQKTLRVAAAANSPNVPAIAPALTPALVIGDPPAAAEPRLAGGRSEAERIASLYGATLLTGERATRDKFVASARTSALIHYAGHAVNGALLLASSDSDTGFLEKDDIAHLSLARRPLVVLAACESFRDLSPAFLDAGARGVVGTLWEIDDDVSAPLFLSFHERLLTGESPARALREAQLAMLHSSDPIRRQPASWGGVELISNSAI